MSMLTFLFSTSSLGTPCGFALLLMIAMQSVPRQAHARRARGTGWKRARHHVIYVELCAFATRRDACYDDGGCAR